MLNKLLKSVLDQDRAPIVVCNTDDIIVYMNPSAKSAYHKDLTGSNIKDCHPKEANEKIDKVIRWFMERHGFWTIPFYKSFSICSTIFLFFFVKLY